MPRPDYKMYIIPAVIVIILMIVSVIVGTLKKRPVVYITPTPAIGVSPAIQITESPTYPPTPAVTLAPQKQTGAMDDAPPQTELDLAAQKNTLRKLCPFKQPSFSIDFDYATDKFVVTLADPKIQSQDEFDAWLKSAYPAIPADRFLFK
jgi:hypothetical protein